MSKTIAALYDNLSDAHDAVFSLSNTSYFSANDINVISQDTDSRYSRYIKEMDIDEKTMTATKAGAGAGATAGTVVGALAGLLIGTSVVILPGIGAILALGPVGATLAGAGAGALLGGLTGALVGLGIDSSDAEMYTEAVRRGGTLVLLRCDNAYVDKAVEILERYNPIDVEQRAAHWRSEGWTGVKDNDFVNARRAASVSAATNEMRDRTASTDSFNNMRSRAIVDSTVPSHERDKKRRDEDSKRERDRSVFNDSASVSSSSSVGASSTGTRERNLEADSSRDRSSFNSTDVRADRSVGGPDMIQDRGRVSHSADLGSQRSVFAGSADTTATTSSSTPRRSRASRTESSVTTDLSSSDSSTSGSSSTLQGMGATTQRAVSSGTTARGDGSRSVDGVERGESATGVDDDNNFYNRELHLEMGTSSQRDQDREVISMSSQNSNVDRPSGDSLLSASSGERLPTSHDQRDRDQAIRDDQRAAMSMDRAASAGNSNRDSSRVDRAREGSGSRSNDSDLRGNRDSAIHDASLTARDPNSNDRAFANDSDRAFGSEAANPSFADRVSDRAFSSDSAERGFSSVDDTSARSSNPSIRGNTDLNAANANNPLLNSASMSSDGEMLRDNSSRDVGVDRTMSARDGSLTTDSSSGSAVGSTPGFEGRQMRRSVRSYDYRISTVPSNLEDDFRKHLSEHPPISTTQPRYEDYRDAYALGAWLSRYEKMRWEQIQAEAHKMWAEQHDARGETWEEVKDRVKYAWHTAKSKIHESGL